MIWAYYLIKDNLPFKLCWIGFYESDGEHWLNRPYEQMIEGSNGINMARENGTGDW